MKNFTQALLATALIAGAPLFAQKDAPEIKFDSVPNALQLPPNIYLGEVGGVATNSRGNIFVYTRTGHPTVTIGTARPFAHGGSRLFEFDPTGKYIREIGKDFRELVGSPIVLFTILLVSCPIGAAGASNRRANSTKR